MSTTGFAIGFDIGNILISLLYLEYSNIFQIKEYSNIFQIKGINKPR